MCLECLYTPLEFEKLDGKSAKKWKSSLSHGGHPLSDYSLACSAAVAPQASIPVHVATQAEGTMIIDVVLAFIKAYCLRGDKNSLSTIVLDRFDQSAVEHSKQLLWESCKTELEDAGLVYHQRRSSDKREQINADLEDILAAVDALDVTDKIPPIYCEATELLKLPPLSLDPVSAQVQDNTKSLVALTSVITDLEKRLSTFQSTRSGATDDACPQVSKQASTYHILQWWPVESRGNSVLHPLTNLL